MSRWPWFATLATLAALAATACADADAEPAAPVGLQGTVTVFAASSLTESFKAIGEAFEAQNPKVTVTFNFAASSALATQINEGAPASVFASADIATMKGLADKGRVGEAKTFARNTPVVVTAKGATAVQSFADLARPGLKLVLAGKDVPIGRYARDILTNASAANGIAPDFSTKVLANLKSEEANVRAVLTKVQLGEADAGVVYATDVGAASGDVRQVEIPPAFNVVAEYPIAVVNATKPPALAAAFVAFVRGEKGQAALAAAGFKKP